MEIPQESQQSPAENINSSAAEPSRKSLFVNDNDLKVIDLGNGNWVKIPKKLPFEFIADF